LGGCEFDAVSLCVASVLFASLNILGHEISAHLRERPLQ